MKAIFSVPTEPRDGKIIRIGGRNGIRAFASVDSVGQSHLLVWDPVARHYSRHYEWAHFTPGQVASAIRRSLGDDA